jgi:hypothetical protein
MIRLPAALFVAVTLAACTSSREPVRQIPIARPATLPLALNEEFSFRKVNIFLNDPRLQPVTHDEMILFERRRLNFGAISAVDTLERLGQYFTVWWRATRPADVTLRLEFRQENLGSYVQAKEIPYHQAKGTVRSTFTIIGDEYTEGGKVTAWRLLLIENGRIVGLRQSFLWD